MGNEDDEYIAKNAKRIPKITGLEMFYLQMSRLMTRDQLLTIETTEFIQTSQFTEKISKVPNILKEILMWLEFQDIKDTQESKKNLQLAESKLVDCIVTVKDDKNGSKEALDAFRAIKDIPEAQEKLASILTDYQLLEKNFEEWLKAMDDPIRAKQMVDMLENFSFEIRQDMFQKLTDIMILYDKHLVSDKAFIVSRNDYHNLIIIEFPICIV